MFKRFSFKTKYLTSFLCVAYMCAATAAEPIILNNAEVTTNYSAYGFMPEIPAEEPVTLPIGSASPESAVQQSMIIDRNNIQYSAYKSTIDNRLYALKFVNNQWVSAADGNGVDGLVETVGDVAPLLNGATGPLTDDPDYTESSKTVVLTTGVNGELYLGYIDEVGGSELINGDNNLHIFELITVDGTSSWQLLTTLDLMGDGSLTNSDDNVHDMELEVDSSGNIYALLNSHRPGIAASGKLNHGKVTVAKYTKSTSDWQQIGDSKTAVTFFNSNRWFFPSSLALSATDDVYLGYSGYIDFFNPVDMKLRVKKFDEATQTWNEVGDPDARHDLIGVTRNRDLHQAVYGLDMDVAPSGKIFVASHTFLKWLVVVSYDPFEEVEEGESPTWKIPYATAGGVKLDEIDQGVGGRGNYPGYDITIAVNSNGLPYVAYGEWNLNSDNKSIVLLGIQDELNTDNEIVSNWVSLPIPYTEASSSGTPSTTPTGINLVLGRNDRPYLFYRDEAGEDLSRAVRANVSNSTELIELSVVEEEYDAGNVFLEIDGVGEPSLFANYIFGNHPDVDILNIDHLGKFVASDLVNGDLILAPEGDFTVGANINFPFLLLDLYAEDIATGDKSHVEPVTVKVSFEASEDPEVQAKRGFAFSAYLCGEDPSKCEINVNENDPIIFEYIQSKIEGYTMIGGNLPDGVTFDVTDPTASFEGKPSYTSTAGIGDVASYPFSITANPIEGSLNNGTDIPATPVTIEMTLVVTNTPINVEADYATSEAVNINENDFLSVSPTVDIGTEFFDIVWDTNSTGEEGEVVGTDYSWLKFDRLTGEISGQSRYIHAGTYRGTVYATGYDEGERDGDRLQFPVEIVVNNVAMNWTSVTPDGVTYTKPDGELDFSILENETVELGYVNEAVQYFYIKAGSTLPDFITLDLRTGSLAIEPDFEDESVEPYTFTIVAQGWDAGVEGEYAELVHNITVDHANASPSLERVLGAETEGVNPVFIDILGLAYDVDSPGFETSYNGQVFMVYPDDENYADYTIPEYEEDGITQATDPLTGELLFQDPIKVPNTNGPAFVVENVATDALGNPVQGTLEVVANGFIYTPSVNDPDVVIISYVVKDNEGQYQNGQTGVRVNSIKEVNYDHASKGGAMGSLLALFAFMLTIRLYKRKVLFSVIALSLLIVNPALSAPKEVEKESSYPWFVQLSVGAVVSSNAKEQALDDLTALGHDITSLDFEQDSLGYIFELGYKFNENWAVTAGYIDFGETAFDVKSSTGYSELLIDDLNEAAPRYGNGNTYSVIYSYPIADAVIISADVGLLYLESESVVTIDIGTEGNPVYFDYSTSEHSLQYFLGTAIEYQYKGIRVGVQYRHYDINGVGTEWVGTRLGYHF